MALFVFFKLDRNLLSTRGRLNTVSMARSLVAYFAITVLGIESADVVDLLNVSQSGVSKLVQKGRVICQRDQISLSAFMADS